MTREFLLLLLLLQLKKRKHARRIPMQEKTMRMLLTSRTTKHPKRDAHREKWLAEFRDSKTKEKNQFFFVWRHSPVRKLSVRQESPTRFVLIGQIEETIFIFDDFGIVQICFHFLHHQRLKYSFVSSRSRHEWQALLRHRFVWRWRSRKDACSSDDVEWFPTTRSTIDDRNRQRRVNAM